MSITHRRLAPELHFLAALQRPHPSGIVALPLRSILAASDADLAEEDEADDKDDVTNLKKKWAGCLLPCIVVGALGCCLVLSIALSRRAAAARVCPAELPVAGQGRRVAALPAAGADHSRSIPMHADRWP